MDKIVIRTARLEDGVMGGWDPHTRTIWLDDRLTPGERRSTLTHERIHAERGDTDCASDWHTAKQERLVRFETARRLIGFTGLAEALKWCRDEHELAEHFGVDVDTVLARLEGLSFAEREMLDELVWAA